MRNKKTYLIIITLLISFTIYYPLNNNVKGEKENLHNTPPNPPTIEGPLTAVTYQAYQYNITLTDPDNDLLIGYEIDFGDTIENSSCCPIPSNTTLTIYHMWYNPGVYNIKARAKDGHGAWSNWSTPLTINVTKGDTVPPIIHILKPKQGLYINNKHFLPLPTTIIIGKITVEIEALDNDTGIKKIEFYIQNTLKEKDYTTPYTWDWNEKNLGRYTLTIKAYDFAENTATTQTTVWKIL